MALAGTPFDYVLDVCLLQLPKLLTVETMVQYHLPLVHPFFVDSMWGPVFSWLLTRDMVLGPLDMRAHFLMKLDCHIRNLQTLAVTYEGGSASVLRAEQAVYEQISAGLAVRPQPPSPHTTWEDVVHLLSTCADLASHVRLFASLGHSVSGKAVLLGEMLGVACAEHRGLLSREGVPLFKAPAAVAPSDARAWSSPGPVDGAVFGPCVGWDIVRGAAGGDPRVFNGVQGPDARGRAPQSDAREWAAAVGGDPCIDWGARSPWSPIAPPQPAEPKHRPESGARRRRAREGVDDVEPRLSPPPRRAQHPRLCGGFAAAS